MNRPPKGYCFAYNFVTELLLQVLFSQLNSVDQELFSGINFIDAKNYQLSVRLSTSCEMSVLCSFHYRKAFLSATVSRWTLTPRTGSLLLERAHGHQLKAPYRHCPEEPRLLRRGLVPVTVRVHLGRPCGRPLQVPVWLEDCRGLSMHVWFLIQRYRLD